MIDLSLFRDSSIAVLGLGRTGLVAAETLHASGVPVTAWDDNAAQVDVARQKGIPVADLATADLAAFNYLLLSPGIPHEHPAPHPVVTRAKEAGLAIVSDIELLARADPAAKYICVTGTNGKSTTTALIGHILQKCGIKCQIGGNLGQGVLGFEPMGQDGVYVIEMSSYQLEITSTLAPDIAVLLNITPDHLARHGGMEGYVAAKRSIFNQGTRRQLAVISIDDEPCRIIARAVEAERCFEVVTISLTGIQSSIMVDEGIMTSIRSGTIADLGAVKTLPGAHNWQNMAAAFAATRGVGLEPFNVIKAMESFPGLIHRQQMVAEIGGVAYINDSKATNADATEKALLCYRDIYWIVGGQAKDGGLHGLELLISRIRHAFLIGEAQDQFAAWMDNNNVAYTRCGTLDVAFQAANEAAQAAQIKDAVVLLSPACASWDQFTSFEHRGERFIELVHELQQETAA